MAKYTLAQYELAVDYIAENHCYVVHPEDNDVRFFLRNAAIEKKVAAMTPEERAARAQRSAQYIAQFKKNLLTYFQEHPQNSGLLCDYEVNATVSQAVEGTTNVSFSDGFWGVSFSEDGKVFKHLGKYDSKGTEITPSPAIDLEEKNTSMPAM